MILENKSYYLSKDKKKKETTYFEYDKVDGYEVKPKTHKEDSIEVSKIIFVNPELSEKIIRKKIDKKIDYLLKQLKQIEEDDGDNGMISKTLIDAENLRIQILTNYVKYLGNTYGNLTLRKIQIIIEQLKYKIFINRIYKPQETYDVEKQGKRGR